MARPSGQNTTKPSTMRAMVAGVHAGRINAVVFIVSRSFGSRQHDLLLISTWEAEKGDSRDRQIQPDKTLNSLSFFKRVKTEYREPCEQAPKGRADAEQR